jgi:glycosyltransferase involved in cell wall biosynthesis
MVPSRQQLEDTRRSHLLSRDRVHVVPNGIDTEIFRGRSQFEARAELGLGNGTVLVSAGRLNREKGFDVAIRALARLNSGARLAIVGSGEEQAALEALTRDLGLGGRVLFVGKQPPERVAAYIAAADVVLFPTLRDEAAGLVLLEAMACERPVVASRVGGIPEVIDDGTSGVLVSPGDMSGLVAAVEPLLANDARRAGMGAAARRRILAEYTVDLMIERTVAVFRIAAARMGRSL